MGSWAYSYDAVGNLVEQTDAKGQVIEFDYDQLNRLTRKWYPPAWNSEPGSSGASRSTLFDLIELRAAIDADRVAAGLSAATWTDPEPTSFRGSYITEFMNRIQDLWTAASLGNVPNLIGGNFNAFIDLFRSWLYDSNSNNTSYETSSWAETRRARAFYEYDGTSAGSGKGRRTSPCGMPPAAPHGPTMSMAGSPTRLASSTAGPTPALTPTMRWIGSGR